MELLNASYSFTQVIRIPMKDLTTGQLTQKLQRVFNQFIRLRDKSRPCISCGSWNDLQAGHYFPAGHYSWLRFDETNVNHQCKRCNYFLSGNQAQYRVGLLTRYGQKTVENLEMRAMLKTITKHGRFELIQLIAYYKQKIKELK